MVRSCKEILQQASTDTDIQTKLARLAITADSLTAANTLISELESAKAEYLIEVGESQDATKAKDAAFAKMDDWMSEFYAVARMLQKCQVQAKWLAHPPAP